MNQQTDMDKIHFIPLDEIQVSSECVRITQESASSEALASSIETHGLLQPVVLSGAHGSPPYQLISGRRRLLAHQKCGKYNIKAVFSGKLDKIDSIILSLVENLQREDLNFADTQVAITELYKNLGSEEELQKRTGLSLRKIRNYLSNESRFSRFMIENIESGKISITDTNLALRAAQDNVCKAEELIEFIIEEAPTANIKRRLVKYGSSGKNMSVNCIISEASRPHVEQHIALTLDKATKDSLNSAAGILGLTPVDVIEKALEEWLTNFL